MAVYKVTLPAGGHTVQDGNNSVIVVAGSEADAKAAAANFSSQDAAPWDEATVTEVVEDGTFNGLRLEVVIAADAGNGWDADKTFSLSLGGASLDTVDEIGDALVTAMNADDDLAGVTYTSGSDTIAIVEANNCGLADITAKVYKTFTGGDEFEVTSLAPTVGAVGADASSERTIVITSLSSGTNPAFVIGGRA